MQTVSVRIEGISPLIMHSSAGQDSTHPLRKESRKIIAKGAKKRTEADEERLQEIDFILSLYWNDQGPFLPEENILGSIRDGARRSRGGKEVIAGVMVSPNEVPLISDAPKTIEKLFASSAHRDVRSAKVQRQGVMRCRARFNKWAAEFELVFDPKTIGEKTVKAAIEDAGRYCGICDFRPRFGRYEVTKWQA